MATYWENSCSFGLRYVSWYECLIVGLVFSHLGFWSGGLFLIAPFPDLCLLVPLFSHIHISGVLMRWFMSISVRFGSTIEGILERSITSTERCFTKSNVPVNIFSVM